VERRDKERETAHGKRVGEMRDAIKKHGGKEQFDKWSERMGWALDTRTRDYFQLGKDFMAVCEQFYPPSLPEEIKQAYKEIRVAYSRPVRKLLQRTTK
jgi:hypothetical protein